MSRWGFLVCNAKDVNAEDLAGQIDVVELLLVINTWKPGNRWFFRWCIRFLEYFETVSLDLIYVVKVKCIGSRQH